MAQIHIPYGHSRVAKLLPNVIISSINPAITLAGFAVTLDKKEEVFVTLRGPEQRPFGRHVN